MDILFKVKKIKAEVIETEMFSSSSWRKINVEREFIGFLIPNYEVKYGGIVCDENKLTAITINGLRIEVNKNNLKLSNTRICNKDLKDKLSEIILIEKERYKKVTEVFKHKEIIGKLMNEIYTSANDVIPKIEEISSINGCLTENEFLNKFYEQLVNTGDLSIGFKICNGILKNIFIKKEYSLGKYLNQNNKYSFLTVEYDGELLADEDFQEYSSFQKIFNSNFNNINTTKIEKYDIITEVDLATGDKGSATIIQEININFNIELKENNVKEASRVVNKAIKLF